MPAAQPSALASQEQVNSGKTVTNGLQEVSDGKDADFDIDDFLENSSLTERMALLAGHDLWHTVPNKRFGIPSVRMSDGPNGVRGTKLFGAVPAACFPCGTGLASTWDKDLLHKAGILIGQECLAKGASCWLGPTTNIQRSPLGGRGFESFSEDPFLSGKLGGSYINGVQSTGVIATLKHFVCNDQEHQRIAFNSLVDERALRETYLLPFQIAIADSNPGSIMTAYNRVNGKHCSEDKNLIEGILRGEWGWKGLVMSDWFGTYSTSEALNAGLDLEMPGFTKWRGYMGDVAVSSGKVDVEILNQRVRNVLEFVKKAAKLPVSKVESGRDYPEDRALNRKLAADSVVLLKNDDQVLPLRASEITEIALIGPGIKVANYCGGGSASLEAYYTTTPEQGILAHLNKDVKVHYEIGTHAYAYVPELRAPDITTPDGKPGCRVRFYSEPPQVADRELIDENVINETVWQFMSFSHPRLEKLFYTDIETIFVPGETAMYEFGLAVHGTVKLYLNGDLLIDQETKQRGGTFFFSKGTVEEKTVVKLEKGKEYHLKAVYASSPASKLKKPGVVNFGGGAGRFGVTKVIDEDEAIAAAVKIAKENKHTIVVAGINRTWESEGWDRSDMKLPGSTAKLISAVIEANPNAVVVSQSGTPVDCRPWADICKTHVHAWYGGNELGNGLADVLFGAVNANGKLPLTFPRRLEDNPSYLNFGSERGRVVYGESIYVGYKYYEAIDREVLYPFGHGLSYTQFEYSNLEVSSTEVKLSITNTGDVAGAETVQAYVSGDEEASTIRRPKKELKGFVKVFLQPKETVQACIPLDKRSTQYWDEILKRWVNEAGTYTVYIGSSSADIRIKGCFTLEKTVTWSGL